VTAPTLRGRSQARGESDQHLHDDGEQADHDHAGQQDETRRRQADHDERQSGQHRLADDQAPK